MSAIVIVCKSDRVELLSDAALFDPESGTVGAIHSKMTLLPEINCVMSGRGPLPVLWITAYVAGLTSVSFDDLIANFGEIAANAATYNNGTFPAEAWKRAEISLVGWSKDRGRPEAYMTRGYGTLADDLSAVNLSPCDVGIFADGSVDVAEAFVAAFRQAPDAFDAETDGVAIMELMRREALSSSDPVRVGRCIGGYVEHATISQEGVTKRTIHEWPDEIGKPIRPSASTGGAWNDAGEAGPLTTARPPVVSDSRPMLRGIG
jgi:hypothetical protein